MHCRIATLNFSTKYRPLNKVIRFLRPRPSYIRVLIIINVLWPVYSHYSPTSENTHLLVARERELGGCRCFHFRESFARYMFLHYARFTYEKNAYYDAFYSRLLIFFRIYKHGSNSRHIFCGLIAFVLYVL